MQQGLRAVNQAMGRVIRHRWDYGAVLLADERFGSQQNLRNMSRWLRDQVVTHGSFGSAIGSLTKFFKVGGRAAWVLWDALSCWRGAGRGCRKRVQEEGGRRRVQEEGGRRLTLCLLTPLVIPCPVSLHRDCASYVGAYLCCFNSRNYDCCSNYWGSENSSWLRGWQAGVAQRQQTLLARPWLRL